MKILEIENKSHHLLNALVNVWERSVKATHLFLSPEEIEHIKTYVPQAIGSVEHLVIAKSEDGDPVAFMGVHDQTLEMLFIDPDESGKGLGKALIIYAIEHFRVDRLTVNEQNPQAKGFYEHMGFEVYKRTELDEQGNPYPLLYMKLRAECDVSF